MGTTMRSSDIDATESEDTQRHFVRAMTKAIDGNELAESERTLLNALFEGLLRGEDVSALTGIKRPHTRRSSDPVHVSLHYLCLKQLMGRSAEDAWRAVGETWGLKRREVQWLIVHNREPALAVLPRFAATPERLLRICERHARGMSGRREAGDLARGHAPAGALVEMLSRLCEVQPASLH